KDRSDSRRGIIGVDVQESALIIQPDGAEHRKVSRIGEVAEQVRITRSNPTNATGIEAVLVGLDGSYGFAIAKAEADRANTRGLDGADQGLIHPSGEHSDDLVELLGRRDANAIASIRGEAEAIQLGVDSATAAVNKDELATEQLVRFGN